MNITADRSVSRTLLWPGVILAVDLLLLIAFLRWAYVEHLHITHSFFYGKLRFSSVDGSLMERWGYVKEAGIVGLAAYAYARTKEFFYAAYAVLFLGVLSDDALRIHEYIGQWLSDPALLGRWGNLPSALMVSGVPLALSLYGFYKLPHDRKFPALMLLAGFCVMAFFAVVVDNLHSLLIGAEHFQTASSFIEDGGELLSLTLITTVWRIFMPVIVPAYQSLNRAPHPVVEQ